MEINTLETFHLLPEFPDRYRLINLTGQSSAEILARMRIE
jgi:hypothetical protein